jgi:hypothetical protein
MDEQAIEGALDVKDMAQARRLVTQLRARVAHLVIERATLAHGYRIAGDNCVRLEDKVAELQAALARAKGDAA